MSLNDEYDATGELSVDLQLRIDQICDAFELSCQRNERPRIEDYLNETLGQIETQLSELVMVELAYRRKGGESPSFDEYVSRFPNYSDALRKLGDQFYVESAFGHRIPPAIQNLESFEFVGAGSFGTVWKAWDTKLLRYVAVKTPIRVIPTEGDRELIQREAQVVARAKHRHIVPVHYAGEVDGRVYVVYEFVAGMTLRDRLREGPFAARDAAALCVKIADALSHVHQLGIVHRDLKPGNVLIDESGEPHVMDFGLAKLLDTNSTIGLAGNPLGTPAYMSPEQAAGRSAETDARSDIYSLGAILYELVSGKPIFQGTPQKLLPQRLFSKPAALSTQAPGVDPALTLICSKCLESNKHDRYRTAADLAADLRRLLNDERVQARPVPSVVRYWRWLNHHRYSTALVLVATVPLVAFLLVPSSKNDTSGQVPVQLTTNPEGATVTVNSCNPKTGEPDLLTAASAISPGTFKLLPGRYRVYVKLQEGNGFRSHEVHRTVPGPDRWPSLKAYWEQSEPLASGAIKWPPINIPALEPLFELVYIPGNDAFTFMGPHGPKTVSIAPFYVATREFTFGDFLKIRPGRNGDVPGRPAPQQPPNDTMPNPYHMAEHWAEQAGCRLLTDLEFTYLAHLAGQAQAGRPFPTDAATKFSEAGGATFDEIPTNPPVRGILTGLAEWTSTWPHSPNATVNVLDKVDDPNHPEAYRIVRGGALDCGPGDYPRKPTTADTSLIYTIQMHVGFRLARTPSDTPPK